ncbi:MAG: RluA family pseudouridine synthase [Porphyromonas sp.]|nr:RluA family pseudouridine synthase [Porphyromonas sp.]
MAYTDISSRILYEDNHLIAVNKLAGELVQGDKTGDEPLSDAVARYLKEKYNKPGNVFVGVIHRLDRPVSGIVLFAKTSKALSRTNELFRKDSVIKKYHAIVERAPRALQGTLRHHLLKNAKQNKSYPVAPTQKGAKAASLHYQTIGKSDRYTLLEVELHTGRHHQIRVQLSANSTTIRGDLKYGARRSLPNGSISLHARQLIFEHPIGDRGEINIVAPYPADDGLWEQFKPL